MRIFQALSLLAMVSFVFVCAKSDFAVDRLKTSSGDVEMVFIGHGSLMFEFNNQIVQVDPVAKYGDYSQFPKADIILITHSHYDHLDTLTIKNITKSTTRIICSRDCTPPLDSSDFLDYGDQVVSNGISIMAVPAYNKIHHRPDGQVFHPPGAGNGYILTFGDKRIYVAGDTENIAEMVEYKNIDVAFLPMNLPYTMTPEMVVDAAKMIRPKILYPYHYGDTDTSILVKLMHEQLPQVEVRIRQLQ